MTRRFRLAALAALTLLAFQAPPGEAAARAASQESFPVESVRPGMTGYGLSVFEGSRVDSFPITILGVLKGYRPGANLILAKAGGAFLERTGIIAGMSGSPVYLNGKLLGAVAYTWSFTKDPLAGITPIGEMLRLFPTPEAPGWNDEKRLGSAESPPSIGGVDPSGAHPIATPLILSGFTPEAVRYLKPWMEERGFVVSPGGGETPGVECDGLVPGGAVGVQLVRGDWSAAAIGTVTYRDGDKVLALGHPFTGMGWVQFPMASANIVTVFASQQISTKVGSPSQPCGAVFADRITGISGEIGRMPSMIPVRVTIGGTGVTSRTYRFEVVRSRLLTPSMISATVVSSISETLNDAGYATIHYDVAYSLNGGTRTIHRGNAILTQSPTAGIGEEISQPLTVLLSDHFGSATLDSVRVTVTASSGLDAAKITDVRVRPTVAAPGDSVEVEVSLRRGAGEPQTRRIRLRVPPQTPEGELTVRACDGDETDRWEGERAPELQQPETFDQLVGLFEAERRRDRIYVQLFRAGGGTTIGGGEISQPPPSFVGVVGTDPKAGGIGTTRGATLTERTIEMDAVARGCETAKLNVVPERR
jgi:hypothetical protein